MARHRNPGSSFTLNGATAITMPFSTARSSPPSPTDGSGPRNRRPAVVQGSPELDVWLEQSQPTSPQPTFSFPSVAASSAPPSPPPKDLPPTPAKSAGGFYKNSSSIAKAREHRSQSPTKLNWRDKGQDFARLKKKAMSQEETVSVQQIAAGAGALAFVVMVVIIFASGRGKSPIVKHMERREQILAATYAPSNTAGLSKPALSHDSFRDELSTSSRYLISPVHGDLAEQVMNLYHLAHLSSVVNRIPIASPFSLPTPDSPTSFTSLPVPSIYDLPRFSQLSGVSILDWQELRPQEAEELGKTEPLGCWIGNLGKDEQRERAGKMRDVGLSASFVPVRAALAKGEAGQGDELKATHDFIARFDQDESAKSGLIDQARHDSSISTASSSRHKNPEQHVFCIDHSLYRPEHPTTRHSTTHLDPRDHTAFFTHGKHLHFAPDVSETAGDLVAHLLGHRNPFLAVHISAKARQSECRLLRQPGKCGVDLTDYLHAVDRVRHIVAAQVHRKSREQRHSARTLSVVVSTDVKDLGFLGELSNMGWTLLDYEDLELRERFGTWAPEVMNQAIESRASGFVGTRGSPQSTLSALRVRTWKAGPTELI
ncbi:hypothetical protein JCM6882_004219 [Rhodosporidiobolus microsporus]